jgi:predicted nucleic acid-binding protein
MSPALPQIKREVWIVNASPFIALAKAELLDLLLDVPARQVYLPHVVVQEIGNGPPGDAAVAALPLVTLGGHVLPPPGGGVDPRLAAFDLDPGEAAVLTEALRWPNSGDTVVVVIDDKKGWQAAQHLGVRNTRTLRILKAAKQAGRLLAVKPAVKAMIATGSRFPEHKLRQWFDDLGETWP